jgi:hypothetical protein
MKSNSYARGKVDKMRKMLKAGFKTDLSFGNVEISLPVNG